MNCRDSDTEADTVKIYISDAWPRICHTLFYTYFEASIIDEFEHAENIGDEPFYPYTCIKQNGGSSKRFSGEIITASIASQDGGPTFEQTIKDGNIYGGIYPTYIENVDGEEIENPASIIKQQDGSTVHFLDMEMLRRTSGVSQINMYDKRDHMGTLGDCPKCPQTK